MRLNIFGIVPYILSPPLSRWI